MKVLKQDKNLNYLDYSIYCERGNDVNIKLDQFLQLYCGSMTYILSVNFQG